MQVIYKRKTILISVFFCFQLACSTKDELSLKPSGYLQSDAITVENGNLKVVFVDNKEFGDVHRAGYNGIAELWHKNQDSTLFVPFYAGFNLEHVFGGDSLVELFEPRRHPMTLYRKSDNEVLLYQEPTPISGVESLTEFKVVEPHFIDITFKCIFHDLSFFQNDYAGLFWASYILRPVDKKIYFKGVSDEKPAPYWIESYSKKHGLKSTHREISDNNGFYFADNFNAVLASHFSDYRYIDPFYYGKFHKMALAFLFDTGELIRFSQSPTGGGETNPAWDFQYLIPNPKKDHIYSFNSRMIYKPFISKEDIEQEYKNWKN